MSTTGIIRRIDELGRIVIPKEIRKNLRIKNGDNLEILVDGENITLKKYSQIENLENMILALKDIQSGNPECQACIKYNINKNSLRHIVFDGERIFQKKSKNVLLIG